ncbi:MAG: Demethylmenaquinone methyltransferase [Alphaproteobacteria bacterium MarineAlpha11_Bin1]|nr:MAG: Demethylmenaquinone methyltransferase [Alphaproteobacteria bacterium MarineAlpha11_Bin1]|tara:strand:- start:8138 stop:8968 length:831 start_codon:yes stop_codon:yes gene_type:complete
MEDLNQVGRNHWKERSVAWTATASEGLSADDTLNQFLIENLCIKSGEEILDIGSGTGDPAISICVSLNGLGTVTACDLTPEMLITARGRADKLGLSNIRFAASDMGDLSFADDVFDCITCRFGLMFPENRTVAAKEALRVLKPGGRVGYMVWGPYDENPAFFVIRRAMAKALGEDEGPPPQRNSLGERGLLTAILEGAGFKRVEERSICYNRPVDDLEDYINRALIRGYLDKVRILDDLTRKILKRDLNEAFELFRDDGKVYLPNSIRLGVGWKQK